MKNNLTNSELPLIQMKAVFPLILLALMVLYLASFSAFISDPLVNRSMLTTVTCFFLISIGSHPRVAELFDKNMDNKHTKPRITSSLLFLFIHFFISFVLFRYVFYNTEMHIAILAIGGTAIGYHYGLHRIQQIQSLKGLIKNIISSLLGSLIGFIGPLSVYQIIYLFNDQLNPSDLLNYSVSIIILGVVFLHFIFKKCSSGSCESVGI